MYMYIPSSTPMHLENRMILKKIKSKHFCCARKKVKVFLPTPIFRLIMTNLHRRVTVGERTSCRAISSLPAHGVRLGNSRSCGPTFKMIYELELRCKNSAFAETWCSLFCLGVYKYILDLVQVWPSLDDKGKNISYIVIVIFGWTIKCRLISIRGRCKYHKIS